MCILSEGDVKVETSVYSITLVYKEKAIHTAFKSLIPFYVCTLRGYSSSNASFYINLKQH